MAARTIQLDPIVVSRGERYHIVTRYQYDRDDATDTNYRGWWFTNVWEPNGWDLFPGLGWIQSEDTAEEAIAQHLEMLIRLMEMYPDDPEPALDLAEVLESAYYQVASGSDEPPLQEADVLTAVEDFLKGN